MSLVKFNPSKIPAHIKKRGTDINSFFRASTLSTMLLPQISIRGKEFALKIGSETVIADPSNKLRVVLVTAKTSEHSDSQRRLYLTKFDNNADVNTPPDCFSDDGQAPAQIATSKQHSSCADCHWAKRGTDLNGRESAACKAYKRVVVMPVNEDGEYMLQDDKPVCAVLDVPLTSLKALTEYTGSLKVPANMLVTELSFERGIEFPKLTFKPVEYVDEDLADVVETMTSDPDVIETCEPAEPCTDDVDPYSPDDEEVVESAPKKKKVKTEKKKKAPEPEPEVEEPEPEVEDDDDDDDDDLLAELDDWESL